MSTSDFLFQGSQPASMVTSSSTSPNTPDWLQEAWKTLVSRGSAIAGEAYTPYQGPRVAGFSPLQEQEQKLAGQMPGRNNALVQQGGQAIQGAIGQPFDEDAYNSYLAPYLKGANSEIDSLTNLVTTNLTENILPAISSGFIGAGMFGQGKNGTSPMAVADDRAIRNANTSLLQAQGGVLNNAYNNAMSSYQTNVGQRMQGGAQLGALGSIGNNIDLQNLGALGTVGAKQQAQTQANYDVAHQDFLNQRDYPIRNLDLMGALIHGYNIPVGSSTYQSNPSDTNLAGMGYGATNLIGALGNFVG